METTALQKKKIINKDKVKTFLKDVAGEFKTEHCDFRFILIKCVMIAACILLSMFCMPFAYLALGLALIFSGFELTGRALYYIVFLMPLMQIFRARLQNAYFLIYVVALVIAVLGIKLLFDVIKKRKKINWLFTIIFAIICIYFTIFMQAISFWGSIMLGLFTLFVAYYYKEDLSSKELTFAFAAGIIFACFIGLFRDFSRLPEFVESFYYYHTRYCGAYINPNVLMGEALFCLALLMVLYLNGSINYIFYPLSTLFGVFVLSTISKVGIIALILISILLLFFVFFKGKKFSKINICKAVACVLSIVLCFGICFKHVNACMGRLEESVVTESTVPENSNETPPISGDNTNAGDKTDLKQNEQVKIDLTELTTGRIDIWGSYLKKIIESPKSIIIGYGIGAPFIGEWRGTLDWQPHNTFIQCVYYVGILGVFLLLLWFLSVTTKENIKRFNWYCVIALIALGLYLCDAEFFSFRLGIYMILLIFIMQKKDKIVTTASGKTENVNYLIPKVIHYIWLGGNDLPKVAQKCIESWKQYCPDYEIKRWDESNLNIDLCSYSREAYDVKKYAFTSDVLRFEILHREGGIYLDIDVELLANLDDLLTDKMFMAFETDEKIAPGLAIGAVAGNNHLQALLDMYKNLRFNENGKLNTTTVCEITTNYLKSKGLVQNGKTQVVDEVKIYSRDYFCPLSPVTWRKEITQNTKAIHLYYASWLGAKAKIKKYIKRILNFVTNGYFGLAIYRFKERNK